MKSWTEFHPFLVPTSSFSSPVPRSHAWCEGQKEEVVLLLVLALSSSRPIKINLVTHCQNYLFWVTAESWLANTKSSIAGLWMAGWVIVGWPSASQKLVINGRLNKDIYMLFVLLSRFGLGGGNKRILEVVILTFPSYRKYPSFNQLQQLATTWP